MDPIITHKQERELDARIAEKVMQEKVVWADNKPFVAHSHDNTLRSENAVPPYCSSVGAAMTVAMQLRRLGFIIHIIMDERGTTLTVMNKEGVEIAHFDNIISHFAQVMCHAALIAVGEERRRGEDRRSAKR